MPSSQPLLADTRRPSTILSAAAELYRRHPARVVAASACVFAPISGLEVALHELESHLAQGTSWSLLALSAGTGFTLALAEVILAGILDESVSASLAGSPLPPVWEIMRRLPFASLIYADLMAAFFVAAAFDLFVLPGLFLLTLLCITGPVIVNERLGPVAGLQRSAVLIWPRIWTALLTVGLPLMLEAALLGLLVSTVVESSWLVIVGCTVLFGVSVGAFVALCEVVLGHAAMREATAS